MNGFEQNNEYLIPPMITQVIQQEFENLFRIRGNVLDCDNVKLYADGIYGSLFIGEGTPVEFVGDGILVTIPYGTTAIRGNSENQQGATGLGNPYSFILNEPEITDFIFDNNKITFDNNKITFDKQ